MEAAAATDVCGGISKSKNITVHGNATIIEQTDPKFVYSVEQREALERVFTICNFPISNFHISPNCSRLRVEKG